MIKPAPPPAAVAPSHRHELHTLSRATLSSIGATGLEFAVLPSLVRVVERWIAFAAVQLLANLVTFLLYKYWAFPQGRAGAIRSQYARQSLVFTGSWLLNTAIPSWLSYRLGLGPVLAFALSNLVVYLGWNYPLNRWWVFAHRAVLSSPDVR